MLIRRFIPISAGAAHLPPPAATMPRAEPGQHIAQRAGGLQDVVHRAEQGGVGGSGDPGILGRRLHHRDVAPAFEGDALTGHRRHLRRFLDADHASSRAHLVPQQAAAQAGPASHVQDHLPLSFSLGMKIPEVPYQVAQWRRVHPGEEIPDGHVFIQPWPAEPSSKRRDQMIYYQFRADRARRTLRGIDEQVAKAAKAVAGLAPVKRNRFIALDGAVKSVNANLRPGHGTWPG